MSTFRNPVGPQSSKVYWRRRLIVVSALLAVIVIIILIVVRPGRATSAKKAAGSSTPTVDRDRARRPPPRIRDACAPGKITLEAIIDKTSYAAGVNPMISMKITNTGTTACTFNLGSTAAGAEDHERQRDLLGFEGLPDRAVDTPTVLKPGSRSRRTPIAWDRTRSSTTTCSASQACRSPRAVRATTSR